MKHRTAGLSVLTVMVALAACGGDPPPPPEPEPTGPTAEELAQRRADSLAELEARRRADSIAAAEAERRAREAREAAVRAARETLQQLVFFEFDRSDLTPATTRVLRQKAEILRASPNVSLRLAGHADERGSTEYNLALGQRRAESVMSFFTNFGLNASRFTTISYGEERPLVRESNEEAWAQNRRVAFEITAGANQINPPGNMDGQDR